MPTIQNSTPACCVLLTTTAPTAGFIDASCYDYFLLRMKNHRHIYRLQIHAYALLPQAVWLLLTPGYPNSITKFCTALNRNYSAYFNQRYRRNIQVWRNKPRVTLMPHNELTLECQKFIERQPLEQALTHYPGCYPWSSFCPTAFGEPHPLLSQHEITKQFITKHKLKGYREFIIMPFEQARLNYLQTRFVGEQ
ncbi:MAG: hypothetical protein ACR2PR_02625 [Pseudohongiellaceae bacterium]